MTEVNGGYSPSGGVLYHAQFKPVAKDNLSYILAIGVPISNEQNSVTPKSLMSACACLKPSTYFVSEYPGCVVFR
ncbi:MAG: hypothetical protein LUQ65_03460 [Candidatus Helarchaeota archaeon]|nr:hypothetical protein [Candidatus Helarchaeota archaeon]